MKAIAVLCFAIAAVFLFLTALQVITRGWGPLHMTVMDYYFIVLPSYLLLIAGTFTGAGLLVAFATHPQK